MVRWQHRGDAYTSQQGRYTLPIIHRSTRRRKETVQSVSSHRHKRNRQFSRYVLSRSVFLRSIFKLFSAGVWLKLRSVSRGRLRVKAGFSPRTLCPFSLMSWNVKPIGDMLKSAQIMRDVNSGWSISFKGSLVAQVLDLLLQADPGPRNPKWKKCVPHIFITSQWPVLLYRSAPSWLPVPHYHRDNHHVHGTQGTRSSDKLFTCRRQTFEGDPIYHHSSHCDFNKSLWARDHLTFSDNSISRFSNAAVKYFYRCV